MEIMEKRTAEETLEWLQKYDKQCDEEILQEIQRVKKAFRKRKGLALDKWAYDNARFNRADIIESQGTIILVDSRRGRKKMYANELYVEYRGPQLTRKLEPRKDGQIMSIYDDGREVKKIATSSINRDNSVSAKQKEG